MNDTLGEAYKIAKERCHHLLPKSIVQERIRSGGSKAAGNAATPADEGAGQAASNEHPETGLHGPDFPAFMVTVSRLLKDKKGPKVAPIKAPGFGFAPI